MTVIANEEKMVPLPSAKPGDRFDLQIAGQGTFVLKLLPQEPVPSAKVTIEKRDGYTVGVLDRPIDYTALREALRDFP